MKILLVLNPIDEERPAGLGRSVYNFALGLVNKRPQDNFVLFTKDPINLKKLFPGSTNIIEAIDNSGKSIWWSSKLKKQEFDIVITFTPVVPVFFFHKKIISFAHDFAYLRFGSPFNKVTLWCAHQVTFIKSSCIVAVSEETKKNLYKSFLVRKSTEVEVIYNGFDHFKTVEKETNFSFARPYFLAVGVLKERKNTLNTILAFSKFLQKKPDFTLLIIGNNKTRYGDQVKRRVQTLNLEGRVSFLDFVDDATLANAYSGTSGLVFPSLVEGFGFPVLEAMAYGVPVVTSKDGALEEVAGNAAVLVDPYDVEDITRGMFEISTLDKKNELIDLGKENIKRFQWVSSHAKLSELVDKNSK